MTTQPLFKETKVYVKYLGLSLAHSLLFFFFFIIKVVSFKLSGKFSYMEPLIS